MLSASEVPDVKNNSWNPSVFMRWFKKKKKNVLMITWFILYFIVSHVECGKHWTENPKM